MSVNHIFNMLNMYFTKKSIQKKKLELHKSSC